MYIGNRLYAYSQSDHQQTSGRGMERERTLSPFSIDLGFHVRRNRAFLQSAATKNASPFRSPPGNPAGFQAIGPPIKKGTFLMA